MGRLTSRRASASLFAAALLLAACGGEDAQTDASDTSVTTTAPIRDDVTTTTIAASGEEPETSTADDSGTVVEVSVSGGSVDGGGRTKVPLGDTVTIRVTSDVADHIHLHGYDVMVDIAAGGTGELVFDATIPGVFEVELEDARIQLLELEIS